MNNTFYTACDKTNSGNKTSTYNCCINTCLINSQKQELCFPLCSQIFPIVKNRCAFKYNCWVDGTFDNSCINQNRKQIYQCCMEDCGKYKNNKDSYYNFDCKKYCNEFNVE